MAKVYNKYIIIILCDWNAVIGNSHFNWNNVVLHEENLIIEVIDVLKCAPSTVS